jgi:hypothetical protein
MQYLLLGINAHINYDLVLTLHEILREEWPEAGEELRAIRKSDHFHVNAIIARTVDTVQDEIIEVQSPMMDVIDKLMGRVDEYLLSQLIKRWRNDVWDTTMSILHSQDPEHLSLCHRRLEDKVMRMAERILLK